MGGPVELFIQMSWKGEVDLDVVGLREFPRRGRVAGRHQKIGKYVFYYQLMVVAFLVATYNPVTRCE